MGEEIEFFQQRRREAKERKRRSLEKAESMWGDYARAAELGGYFLVASAPGHWLVRRQSSGKLAAQFWPSARKWQRAKNGKVKRGSPEKFMELLERGVF